MVSLIPRNRELMRVYRDLELVEQLGSGVPRILENYEKECFHFMENFTRMTFPASEEIIGQGGLVDGLVGGLVDGLVESQRQIVDLIRGNPNISKKEMSMYIGISTTSVDKHIRDLREKKIIKRVGSDRNGHWELSSKQIIDQDGLVGGLVDGLVDGLVESQRQILDLIRGNPKISKKEMSVYIGISTTSVDKHIRDLREKKLIKRVGSDRTGHWELSDL